jgi:hypothetical protein
VLATIRDAVKDKKGEVTHLGAVDKRLLVLEAELASLLKVMYREGNTLSPVLRQLFDCPAQVRSSPKGDPITVTGAHVGVIGQITPNELARTLKENEVHNGFVGRYVWVKGKRVKDLPDPEDYSERSIAHARLWLTAIRQARAVEQVTRDEGAKAQWASTYSHLRRMDGRRTGMPRRHGLAQEACARSHVMVMRMSLIFAALDGSSVITVAHQTAALAVWDFCERCAIQLFGNKSGLPKGDQIIDALLERGPLTRTEISALFGRNATKEEIDAVLAELMRQGQIREEKSETSGRPVTTYTLVEAEQQ